MDREPKKSPVDRLKDTLYSRQSPAKADPFARTPLPHQKEHTPHMWDDVHPVPEAEAPAAEPEVLSGVPYDRTLSAGVAQKASMVGPDTPSIDVMPRIPNQKRLKPPRNHVALYFFIVAFLFFLAAAGVAAYLFFQGSNTISGNNIDISVSAPSIVDSGKPSVIQYVITNRNQEALQYADLLVTYPSGTRSASDLTQDLPQERIPVGDIAADGQTIKTSSAAFFGTEGASEQIGVTLEYRLAGSNAIFTKTSNTSLIIGSSPISISVSAPNEAISGQSFNADVTVTSNATTPLQNAVLEAQFPFGWTLTSADPPLTSGTSLWRLGDLGPGDAKTIHLVGTLIGSDGDARVFHFLAGSEADLSETSLAVPLLTTPITITVRKPFITSTISINGKTDSSVAAPLGSTVDGNITWKNNLSVDATHVVFTLNLSGAPLNANSISTTGFYDSSKSEIVWSEQTDSTFADIAPGATGSLHFSFNTLTSYTKPLLNPNVKLALTVNAERAGQGNVPEAVTSDANTTVTLASDVTLAAAAEHFAGAIANTGPMPPVHNQATTYSILWSLKNSSNGIGSGVVTATLPPYVQFVSAADGSGVSYDATSRTVTWILGDIAAGAGYSAPLRTAMFQLSLTPSVNQVGQIPALTSDVTFTGQDRYADIPVTTTATAPTTRLTSDPGFVQGMEMVR